MGQDKTAQAGTAAQANTTQADAAMQTQAEAAQTLQAINIDGVKLTDVFNEIVQVGIVVEDMDAAIKGMKQLFDLDPDATSDNYYKNTWYRGEIITAPAKAAFYNFFNIQLEFLQPIGDDPSIWQDYLKEGPHHGHALHHLRFNVEVTMWRVRSWNARVLQNIWRANRSWIQQRALPITMRFLWSVS